MNEYDYEEPLQPHPRVFYAYLIWFLCLLFTLYNGILEVSTRTLLSHVRLHFAPDLSVKGNVYLIYSIAIVLFQIPAGLLMDRFGSRQIASAAIALIGLGMILLGMSSDPMLVWIALFLMGFGGTFALLTIAKLIANWFLPQKFAILMAFTLLIIAVFSLLIGQLFTYFSFEKFGWRLTTINYGIAGLVLALLFVFIVRDSEPGAKYNLNPSLKKQTFKEAATKALSSPHNWCIALFFGLAIAPFPAFIALRSTTFFEVVYHYTEKQALLLNTLYGVSFGIGALIFALSSNHQKKRKPFMYVGTIIALFAVSLLLYAHFENNLVIGCLTAAYGFFLGSATLSYTLIHERNFPTLTATVIGMVSAVLALCALIANLITWIFIKSQHHESGYLLNQASTHEFPHAFQYLFAIIPVYLILSLIFLYFVKESHATQTYEE